MMMEFLIFILKHMGKFWRFWHKNSLKTQPLQLLLIEFKIITILLEK